MSTDAPAGEVFVYLSDLAARPGQSVSVHAGTIGGASEPVTVDLCWVGWSETGGKVASTLTPVPDAPVFEARTDAAAVANGSYGYVGNFRLADDRRVVRPALGVLFWQRERRGETQRLLQWTGGTDEISLSVAGTTVAARLSGSGQVVAEAAAEIGVETRRWRAVAVAVDAGRLELRVLDLAAGEVLAASVPFPHGTDGDAFLAGPGEVIVAAGGRPSAPADHLTAKLECPTVADAGADALLEVLVQRQPAAGAVLAQWRFDRDMRSTTIQDAAAGNNPLVLVNSPMRAVTSHSWDGTTLDWRTAPEHYAAAYFHDTDLDDARWARAGEISVPTGTRPGLYAVRCRADGGRADHAPLIVRDPATGTRVAMLLSTFTYLAYANNSTFKHQHFDEGVVVGRSQRDDQLDRHPMLGMSLYDKHSDGSGVSTSSALRPILTMRFDHRSSVQDTPRNLGADLLTASWLDRVAPGHGYLTDHDLHFAGAVPDGVEVLVTGTHPEYVSTQMLDALVAFQRRGGSLMYLGGNGFYWVTTCSAERPHLIEVRRGQSGIRTWESDPGEGGHATTGQPGGLWRHVGRPPNALVGVGMAAQGWDRRAPGYVRAPEAQGPVADRLFAGISDAVLGDFGYAMGGAAGDEVDRMDYDLGTPRDALRLLTSQRHSHLYKIAVEDIPMVSDQVDGTSTDRVRSDVCLMPTGSGGHVFSVGSITWASSLAWNDFDNNIAQLTLNALNFLLHG